MAEQQALNDIADIRHLEREQDEAEQHKYRPVPEVEKPSVEDGQANAQATPQAPDVYSLPDGIMGGFADEFASILSSYLESAKHFFFFSALTCLGLLFSCRVRLLSEINQQPRIYLVLLGESADDRKSTAISKGTNFFDYVKDVFSDLYATCDGAGSAEGLLKLFGRNTHRVLLVYDEFAVFISKAGIESSVLLPCVNTLFEQNRYENATSQNPIVAFQRKVDK